MDYEKILTGGDLRSIGNVDTVVANIHNQYEFDRLFALLFHHDRILIMRAADAIEKITLEKPEYLKKHKEKMIDLCETAENKELKWHLALLVSRLVLTERELSMIWKKLTQWATQQDESKIVRVNALQGLFNLVENNKTLTHDFTATLSQIEKENIPSLNARIRQLQKKIDYYEKGSIYCSDHSIYRFFLPFGILGYH